MSKCLIYNMVVEWCGQHQFTPVDLNVGVSYSCAMYNDPRSATSISIDVLKHPIFQPQNILFVM